MATRTDARRQAPVLANTSDAKKHYLFLIIPSSPTNGQRLNIANEQNITVTLACFFNAKL